MPSARKSAVARRPMSKSQKACEAKDLATLREACQVAGIYAAVRKAGKASDKPYMCRKLREWAVRYNAEQAKASKKSASAAAPKKSGAAPKKASSSAPKKSGSRSFKVISAKYQLKAGGARKDAMGMLSSSRFSGDARRSAGKAFTALARGLFKSSDARARAVLGGMALHVEIEETTMGSHTSSRGYRVTARRAPPKGPKNPFGARYSTKIEYRC